MCVGVVFTLMLNHSFQSFNPIEEDGLQVIQRPLVPYPVNGGHHFFNRLKYPILDFFASVFQIAKSRTDSSLVNKVRGEGGQASDCQMGWSTCDHCDTWNCPYAQKRSLAKSTENPPRLQQYQGGRY
jgi:hypothetical protein